MIKVGEGLYRQCFPVATRWIPCLNMKSYILHLLVFVHLLIILSIYIWRMSLYCVTNGAAVDVNEGDHFIGVSKYFCVKMTFFGVAIATRVTGVLLVFLYYYYQMHIHFNWRPKPSTQADLMLTQDHQCICTRGILTHTIHMIIYIII